MRATLPTIRERGAELIIVGNGRPEHAADFRDREGVESPLFVDPELRAYAAAGLKRSVMSSLSLRVVARGIRAFGEGRRQSATRGDPWQQGGVFVIRPGNVVDFAYVSGEAGDHPAPSDVIDALGPPTVAGRRAARRRRR